MISHSHTLLNILNKYLLIPRKWAHLNGDTLGVNLIGPVEFINGLGTSARGYLSSVANANIPHTVIPWQNGFEHLSKLDIAFPKQDLYAINLVHLNLDLLTSGHLDATPLNEIVTPERYNICIMYWELASILPHWQKTIHKFDEIWCASSFMAHAISAVSARPVKIIRPALDFTSMPSNRNRDSFGLPSNSFIFFYAADAGGIMGRKNPEAFINAYIDEFPSDGKTCCLVKINNTKLAAQEMQRIVSIAHGRPDVIFFNEFLRAEDMSALFRFIDCYVSPHRSEGLGLTILEAMAAEKPVIATQYGGVTDFVTKDTAYPISHRLLEIGSGSPPYPPNYIWAEPYFLSIRENMRYVFGHQAEAKIVGQKGAEHIRNLFSLKTTATALRSELEHVWRYHTGNNANRLTLKIKSILALQCGRRFIRLQKYAFRFMRVMRTQGISEAGRRSKILLLSKFYSLMSLDMHTSLPSNAKRIDDPAPAETSISILMYVYNTDPIALTQTIESIFSQSYSNWELCICNNCSTCNKTLDVIEYYKGLDPRIKITSSPPKLHIVGATNIAMEFATGEFVIFLDHNDTLEPDAIKCVAETIRHNPNLDLFYTSEDTATSNGSHVAPNHKPNDSPECLHAAMNNTPLFVIRKSLLLELGGLREQSSEPHDYDLALRASNKTGCILHTPKETQIYSFKLPTNLRC